MSSPPQPPKHYVGPAASRPEKILRVAAYCRVSTKREEQFHSLEQQVSHYERYIRDHPGWTLVQIFAKHKSGKTISKRPAFQKMLELCREHKIDLILTKSVQRFSRNTLYLLEMTRELRNLNVEVFFENENLYNSSAQANLYLSIFGSLAQNVSEGQSADIRWGLEKGFKNGTSPLASRPCYGYRRKRDGQLKPYPPEAKVVQQIFEWRISGCSLANISRRLAANNTPAPHGGKRWSLETINKLLHNEKYVGDVLLGKTYVPNILDGKQKPNHGQATRYYIEQTHRGIISPETFRLATKNTKYPPPPIN